MQRNKTQRRRTGPPTSTPPSGEPTDPFHSDSVAKNTEDSLDALFAAESHSTFHQPWQKLDRGARLDRLRKFAQTYNPVPATDATTDTLSASERSSLLTAILQAFELRQLNSKAAVDYNPTAAAVISIRGLRLRVAPSGLRTFRIIPPESGAATTVRAPKRSKADGLKVTAPTPSTVTATPAPPKPDGTIRD